METIGYGAQLKALRAGLGITQWDLAKGAGISRVRMWAIESGRVEPRAAEREAIALFLNLPAGAALDCSEVIDGAAVWTE